MEKKSGDQPLPFDPIATGSARKKPEHVSETGSKRFPEDKHAPAANERPAKNDNPETEVMEFHHQLHHAPGKKKHFKHYVFEFLMLFLAITLGFFVENQREHFIERKRAKEYAKTLINDLHEDTLQLKNIIHEASAAALSIDSLRQIILSGNINDISPAKLYWYGEFGGSGHYFLQHDATLKQLLHSGNLRYFTNAGLVRKITRYDWLTRSIKDIETRDQPTLNAARNIRSRIYDAKILEMVRQFVYNDNGGFKFTDSAREAFFKTNPRLLNSDRRLFGEYAELGSTRNGRLLGMATLSKEAVQINKELVVELTKEYRLK